jgi:hypothetical protein
MITGQRIEEPREQTGMNPRPARAKTTFVVYRQTLFDSRIPGVRRRVGPGIRRSGCQNGPTG